MSEQPALMTVPTKRQAPLRVVEKQRFGKGGPLGGKRLYLFLDCGHVQERMRKASFSKTKRLRARCFQCIGQIPNANEAAVRQWADEHGYDPGAHYMQSMAAAAGVEY